MISFIMNFICLERLLISNIKETICSGFSIRKFWYVIVNTLFVIALAMFFGFTVVLMSINFVFNILIRGVIVGFIKYGFNCGSYIIGFINGYVDKINETISEHFEDDDEG